MITLDRTEFPRKLSIKWSMLKEEFPKSAEDPEKLLVESANKAIFEILEVKREEAEATEYFND